MAGTVVITPGRRRRGGGGGGIVLCTQVGLRMKALVNQTCTWIPVRQAGMHARIVIWSGRGKMSQ